MAQALTKTEITHRLQKLRNYEQILYPAARARIDTLEVRVKELEAEQLAWQEERGQFIALVQKLQLQVEALNAKVFGKKKHGKGSSSDPDSVLPPDSSTRSKTSRSADSYRRAIPKDDEITSTQYHSITGEAVSPHRHHRLARYTSVDYYIEDIIMPEASCNKTVTRHTVEKAFCEDCNVWVYGKDLPAQSVILGNNLPKLVCCLYTVGRYSYQQIAEHVQLFYHIKLSDGLIANMTTTQAGLLRPAYERLIDSILQQAGVHFDESTWKMLREKLGHYVWVMTGTETRDAAFFFGQSRGKQVLTDKLLAPLLKTKRQIIGISDDYGAYKAVAQFLAHALCWAHPNRKLRDLAESNRLPELTKVHCAKTYQRFNDLYNEVNSLWASGKGKAEMTAKRIKLETRFSTIAKPHSKDPPELATYKSSLRDNKPSYFVCLDYPGVIPPDNNKAERAIRHLVIKRKLSLGSKTQQGAAVLSVLYSVLLSLHWRKPENYFAEYDKLLQAAG